MKRKDYELIAAAIASEMLKGSMDGWESAGARRAWTTSATAVALNLADALPRTNPQFNRRRFLAACGVES